MLYYCITFDSFIISYISQINQKLTCFKYLYFYRIISIQSLTLLINELNCTGNHILESKNIDFNDENDFYVKDVTNTLVI